MKDNDYNYVLLFDIKPHPVMIQLMQLFSLIIWFAKFTADPIRDVVTEIRAGYPPSALLVPPEAEIQKETESKTRWPPTPDSRRPPASEQRQNFTHSAG